jgi:hypothetical protein
MSEELKPIKYPRTYRIGDARFLAGFTDGEGYLALRKRSRPECKAGFGWWPDIEISNRERWVLVNLMEEWGCGRVEVIRSSVQEGNVKECYRWVLDPNDIRHVLPHILPHLRIKKRLAEILLEALPMVAKGRTRTIEDNARLEELLRECYIINQRGKGHGLVELHDK